MFPEFVERSRPSEAARVQVTNVEPPVTPQNPEPDADVATIDARLRIALENSRRLELAIQSVRHSTGNQLALVSAMLARQARTSGDPAIQQALVTAQRRVHAVAETLRLCGLREDGESVSAKLLAERVAGGLSELAASAQVKIELDVEELALQRYEAGSFMLIMNELAVNSLKHGFPNNMPGEIRIRFAQESHGVGRFLALVVEDDGVGRTSWGANSGLGTSVMLAAAQSLGAKLVEDCRWGVGERRGLRTTILKPHPQLSEP